MALEDVPTAELVPRLQRGVLCIVGRDAMQGHACSDALFTVGSWLVLLFLYNALMTTLIKKAGAMLMMATTVLITPCTNLAYSSPFLMGAHAEPVNTANVVGLVLTVCGMLIYRSKELNLDTAFQG